MSERPDPRDRPADPAGTQPKVDPASLIAQGYYEKAPSEKRVDGDLDHAIGRLDELEHETPGTGTTLPAETEHTPRFQFLFGALIALGALALVALVAVLVNRGDSGGGSRATPTVAWSTWTPGSASAVDTLRLIANHVGATYRQPVRSNGTTVQKQMTVITADPYSDHGVQVAVPDAASGSMAIIGGLGVSYQMCGRGPSCTMVGRPSISRGFVLRRAGLELALDTMHYIPIVENVVVFLPPAPGTPNPRAAILFKRSLMGPALLQQPLAQTLGAPQAATVGRMYHSTLETAAVGSQVLMLTPLANPKPPATAGASGTSPPTAPRTTKTP